MGDWRDLSSPGEVTDCFLEMENIQFAYDFPHDMGRPLGHWFHAMSVGDPENNIIPVGMDVAINLVLDALEILPENSDPFDFGVIILSLARDIFEPCSDELLSIGRALDLYCISYAFSGCSYLIQGNKEICEESGQFSLSLSSTVQGAVYRWSFPYEWEVANSSGNLYYGNHLNVMSIPEYDYYPRTFEVCVYSPTLGAEYRTCEQITIKDCDGDDPDCEDVHSNENRNASISSPSSNRNVSIKNSTDAQFITIHDVLGIKIYEGTNKNNILRELIGGNRLYIVSYFDSEKNWIKSEKKLL